MFLHNYIVFSINEVYSFKNITHFNPNLVGLFRSLKLEIWYVSTHTYIVSENIPFSTKALLILMMLAFLCKKSAFFGKNSTLTQNNSSRAVFEIF